MREEGGAAAEAGSVDSGKKFVRLSSDFFFCVCLVLFNNNSKKEIEAVSS